LGTTRYNQASDFVQNYCLILYIYEILPQPTFAKIPVFLLLLFIFDFFYFKMKKGNILGNNPKMGYDNVFQLGELVDPYRVAPSIELEENLNFCVLESIFVDVDAEELNVVFSSNGYAQVDTDDDNDEINIED
jgi:hypothetical protein